jgi:hypothetical protein
MKKKRYWDEEEYVGVWEGDSNLKYRILGFFIFIILVLIDIYLGVVIEVINVFLSLAIFIVLVAISFAVSKKIPHKCKRDGLKFRLQRREGFDSYYICPKGHLLRVHSYVT